MGTSKKPRKEDVSVPTQGTHRDKRKGEIRRAAKSLRHAQKRGRSNYILERIQSHIQALESRTPYSVNVQRRDARKGQEQRELLRERASKSHVSSE